MRALHRTARAALVGLSTLVLATACKEGAGVVEVTGTYALTAINDAPLPYLVNQTVTETEEIVEGWIVLDPSGRFSDIATYRISGPDVPTQQDTEEFTGDYELVGGEIQFHDDQGGRYTMAREGGSLTQTIVTADGSVVFRYTK